jgi:hypothetical protein
VKLLSAGQSGPFPPSGFAWANDVVFLLELHPKAAWIAARISTQHSDAFCLI